jgi:hypothetical protein
MARINSLQGRIKFPVPMRRELDRKLLYLALGRVACEPEDDVAHSGATVLVRKQPGASVREFGDARRKRCLRRAAPDDLCGTLDTEEPRLIANSNQECRAARLGPAFCRAAVARPPAASAERFRDLFFGAADLGAADLGGLLTVLRRPLPRPLLRFDLIHADTAAELALVSSGMIISLSRANFLAKQHLRRTCRFGAKLSRRFNVGFLGRVLV